MEKPSRTDERDRVMKTKYLLQGVLGLVLSLSTAAACHGAGTSYDSTIASLTTAMAESTSTYRKETYDYITFDKCILNYKVSGTHGSGATYTTKWTGIDFSTFNVKESKAGSDYAGFVMLNFGTPALYDNGNATVPAHTVVVVVSDRGQAEALFKLFKRLGDLCRVQGGPGPR